jgi:hypothetical protein
MNYYGVKIVKVIARTYHDHRGDPYVGVKFCSKCGVSIFEDRIENP